jgi:amidase
MTSRFRSLAMFPRFLLLAAALVGATAARAASVALTDATIVELQAAMQSGSLTAEKLTQMFLARIDAYEKSGPRLHAIITLNPKALDEARALDAERKAGKVRGPLHGIPIVLKDIIDTADLPTTGGFYGLRDSIPPQDAEQTKRLRAAGCIILAKANLSEFASAGSVSTLGGVMKNPHALDRSPSGSSGGTGAGIAAGFAVFGLGTDTGGSIRGPSSACGIVGLKPTLGLNGRGGIMPLALSLDTVGPMARNVADIAAALNVMAGLDPRDPATKANEGKIPADYTAGLKPDALKGARLGLMRDFMKSDPAVDAVIETAVAVLRKQGATIVEVKLPRYVLAMNADIYETLRETEFHVQIEEYLSTLPRKDLPKKLSDIVAMSEKVATSEEGWEPNRGRLETMKKSVKAGKFDDEPYRSAVNEGRKMIRENLEAIVAKEKLDAFITPTSGRPAGLTSADGAGGGGGAAGGAAGGATAGGAAGGGGGGHSRIINLAGWPDLIVPAGVTSDPVLPVTMSFIGPAFSEARLLALGYAFEQALPARVLPAKTPALAGETITY